MKGFPREKTRTDLSTFRKHSRGHTASIPIQTIFESTMQIFSLPLVPLCLLPLVLRTFALPTTLKPTKVLQPRGPSQCGQYTSVSTGVYTVYANMWGASSGSGSQCSQIDGLAGSSLAWSTTWTWANTPNQVKSYTNVAISSTSKQLSQYISIPTTWAWRYVLLFVVWVNKGYTGSINIDTTPSGLKKPPLMDFTI